MFFLFELKNKAKYSSILRLIPFFILSLSTNIINPNQKDDDWFFTALMNEDANLGKEFDDKSITRFLSKKKDVTSCYSPLCAEMNLHLAIIYKEFLNDYVAPSLQYLTALTGQLNNMDKKILNFSNNVYIQNIGGVPKKEAVSAGYNFEIYCSNDDFSRICEEYKVLSSQICDGKYKLDLDENLLKNNKRIYISLLFFNDKWKRNFEKLDEDEVFTLSSGLKKMRRYMYKKEWLRYKEINEEGFNFKIVVVPYSEQETDSQSRVMIYLVPNEHNVDKSVLLNKFWDHIKKFNGINNAINDCSMTLISLRVPKIIDLTTNLNTRNILQDIFKKSTALSVSSEMKINLNVDEEGTSFVVKSLYISNDGGYEDVPIEVKVNVPYIALIYDYNIDRILLVLNDNGPLKAESKLKTSC